MVWRKINSSIVELVQGDITMQQDIEAIVNAANAELMPGGGVAGAIHRVAGEALIEECKALAPIFPGEVVITGGYELPNSYIIHCLGPIFGIDQPADKLLASCYREAIRLADKKGIKSIAFPAISTGAFGYPIEEAAQVAIETVFAELPKNPTVKLVRFVLFSPNDYKAFKKKLDE